MSVNRQPGWALLDGDCWNRAHDLSPSKTPRDGRVVAKIARPSRRSRIMADSSHPCLRIRGPTVWRFCCGEGAPAPFGCLDHGVGPNPVQLKLVEWRAYISRSTTMGTGPLHHFGLARGVGCPCCCWGCRSRRRDARQWSSDCWLATGRSRDWRACRRHSSEQ